MIEDKTSRTNTSFRLLLTGLSIAVYMASFILVFYYGGFGMAITAAIPVFAVAWLFGMTPGIWAALLTVPANMIMGMFLGLEWWTKVFMGGAGIVGTLSLVLIGFIVGWVRDLSVKLRNELAERKKTEDKLRKNRDELNETNKKLKEEMTERQRAVGETRKLQDQLNSLIEASLDPIVLTDSESRIIKANRPFQEMLGFREDEITSQLIYDFAVFKEKTYLATTGEHITIDSAFLSEQQQQLEQFRAAEKISNWFAYYQTKDGRIVPIVQSILCLFNELHEKIGTFAIIRNVTEQRIAENALVDAKETAESANEAKSNFLANMSHEIRTPMNGIIGFSEMLIETPLNEEQAEYAQTIKQCGDTLLSLINDILDFSKIEAGKIELSELDFDIEVLSYEVCELIRPRLQDQDVEIICTVADDVPALLNGDPNRYRQVLVNLLGNAAKFTDHGEIELSLEVEAREEARMLVHARVRDTGIGIPKDKLESIFYVFQQADSSTTRKYGGTGLGLTISRKIAGLMDGNVWAESREGSGSTFHFTAWMQHSAERKIKRYAPAVLNNKRVLITDDNKTNLELLSHVLRNAGMRVVSTLSGSEALEYIKSSTESGDAPDIGVLDIRMPEMSGYELAKRIRSIAGDSLPLLAFSSSAEGTARLCEDAGFNGFLPKPINRMKLLKMMERLLGSEPEDDTGVPDRHVIVTQHSINEEEKHGLSILLAEDNPVNQKLAVKLLTNAGYQVTVASDGQKAVDLYTAAPDKFSVILMDIQMPNMNGLDACRTIRERGYEDVPVVAMTANAMKGDREKCLEAGMSDYIAKPIKREIVFSVLKKWVFDRPRQ